MTALKVLGKKIIIDRDAADVPDFQPDMSGDTYYEVVRLIDRRFLFLQDHLDRLKHSLSGSGIKYPGDNTIRYSLKLLLQYNDLASGNIRICIREKPGGKVHTSCYFISFFYPESSMYSEGVKLLTFPHVRPNPGIKKWDEQFRNSVNNFIRDHDIYEAILMNGKKQVTEGSRSNIFFFDRNDRLVTAPGHAVLPGITRKYVLQICREENIEVVERMVLLEELRGMTACFISGTSPKILPVKRLDGFVFNARYSYLPLLMERFESIMMDNLEQLE